MSLKMICVCDLLVQCPQTCEEGSETRRVMCSSRVGEIHPDSACEGRRSKPATQRACVVSDKCSTVAQWHASQWSSVSDANFYFLVHWFYVVSKV